MLADGCKKLLHRSNRPFRIDCVILSRTASILTALHGRNFETDMNVWCVRGVNAELTFARSLKWTRIYLGDLSLLVKISSDYFLRRDFRFSIVPADNTG